MKRIIEIEKIRITEIIEDGHSTDQKVVKTTVLEGLDDLLSVVTQKVREEVSRTVCEGKIKEEVVEKALYHQDKPEKELSSAPLGLVVPTQPNTWCDSMRYLDQSTTITKMSLAAWNSSLRMNYIKAGFIYCITSTDGETWNYQTPTATNIAAETLSITPFSSKLWMAYSVPGTGQIYVTNSTNGTTWSTPQSISNTSVNGCISLCSYQTSLCIAYIDQSSTVKLCYSSTGATWTAPISPAGWPAAKYVSITEFKGSLFLVFVDTNSKLWVSSSTNPSGNVWIPPIQLGANRSKPSLWSANTCSIVSDSNFLYLSWAKTSTGFMYVASTGASVQASDGSSWSNASQIQSWTGFYVTIVPYTPPAGGFNLFFGALKNGIGCTSYKLVSYTSNQVTGFLQSAFQKPSLPIAHAGNADPAYLPLNYKILNKIWGKDDKLSKNTYVLENFDCDDFANSMKALVAEYSYGSFPFFDYTGTQNPKSDFLWTGKGGLCATVFANPYQTSGVGHAFNCTIDPSGTVYCFEPQNGLQMTLNSNGTVTGTDVNNPVVWDVAAVIY